MATPVTSPKGGQFVLHAKALHGNPYDGHTLGAVIADLEKLTGIETRRIHVDKGYRGHNHPHKFRVWISGQVRRVTAAIRREMKRRAAVEPVIGHLKAEHRMGRNYLKGPEGDRINAVLAAAGYNFDLLLRWLAELLRALIMASPKAPRPLRPSDNPSGRILHGRRCKCVLRKQRQGRGTVRGALLRGKPLSSSAILSEVRRDGHQGARSGRGVEANPISARPYSGQRRWCSGATRPAVRRVAAAVRFAKWLKVSSLRSR